MGMAKHKYALSYFKHLTLYILYHQSNIPLSEIFIMQ